MTSAPLQAETFDTMAALARLIPEWDALADAAGRPACLPAWQLAWWRELAPPGSLLRVVAVRADGQLVGLVPFFLEQRLGRSSHRLLGAAVTHRTEPLVHPGVAAADVAALAVAELERCDPAADVVRLEGIAADGPWPAAFDAAWPALGAPWRLVEQQQLAPSVDLSFDDLDAWLASKSSNFRQQTRRFRRRLEKEGGTVRMSSEQEVAGDLAAMLQLHHQRWAGRGGSSLPAATEAMVRTAAEQLLPAGRLRLWVVELDGRPIGVQLFLAAGGNVLYWNGGFDESASHLKPALLGIVAGIEDSLLRDERLLDLGGGDQDYKLRLADGATPLTWTSLVPRNRRYAANRLALAPEALSLTGRRLAEQLPDPLQQPLRRVVRRYSGRRA
ncbi:GNAT family N-acetyltransferase [Conexibacter woesei]|uniref:Cellulose biosynthesis (CelD)-like protein n=1 Tax=Conexibacter woesei (strain DSM 14684 / CCUG 47730 / CIP 108061 / JCM 11494 / NBRC 100937 / ID131577) TaxID=469383 RepID=D3FFC6_CONWI|nr:GNAT family N-acetyltransferase [Conexibacter woesei]ADB53719.1 cellulose biosynthesis (CelD)-like protein [Conexibacter woesei DSM 14684]